MRKKQLLGLVVFGLVAAGGFVAWQRPAWQVSSEVRNALSAGRYADAAAGIDRWLQLRPSSGEAQFYRAKAALALGKSNDIADGLRQAERLGYPADEIAVIHALISAQRGRAGVALPVLTQAFERLIAPDPMVEEALARVLIDTYDFERAIPVLNRWANDCPTDARPPLWRGLVHRRQGNEPKVNVEDFREALARNPNDADAMLATAEELTKLHAIDEATPLFERYITLRPNDPAGHIGAGRCAFEQGNLKLAAQEYERTIALSASNADAHIELSKVLQLQGDDAGTLTHVEQAIALKPYDDSLRYTRVLTLNRLGRRDEAAKEQLELDRVKREIAQVDAIQDALAKSPKDETLQTQLVSWMFNHGYTEEGLKWARKVLMDHPGHPAVCNLLANHFDSIGDAAQASFFRSQIR